MFIWDDGESVTTTGSVNQEVLDAYIKAKDEGGDLSVFAPFLGIVPEAAPAEEVVPEEAAPEGETKSEFYGAWSLTELQDEAAARGLAKSGNKADLAERLAADDAQPEGE